MTRLLRLAAPLAILAALPLAAAAQAPFDGTVKLGVLNDQSSLYQDTTGPGSVAAVKMAVEDYLAANPKSILKPSVVFADHQNKPDVGSNIAREWFERDGVDAVIDVPNSAVALAVTELTQQLKKLHPTPPPRPTPLTPHSCNP